MKATYTSVWDGGIEVTTACEYNPDTKVASDFEDSGVDGVDVLEDEYVTLPDGTQLRDVTFDY